jgi:tripartite ATP-independent transporter DctP family solute receptor
MIAQKEESMQRIIVAALFFAVSTVTFGQTKIRLAHATAESHPFHKHALMFKEAVEKKTGGRVQVEIFGNRQLGDDRQILEATVAGTIDASLASSVLYSLVVKKAGFDALQLPFLLSSYDNEAKLLTSPQAQALLDDLSSAGLKGLSIGEGGMRHFLNEKGPVVKAADFKGLKTRIVPVPLHKAIWEAIGVSPVGIAYGEVYTSLQTHVIDAVEINASSVNGENLWEPAKHYTLTGHYFWPGVISYNKARFDKLPADVQKALIEAGREVIVPQVMFAKKDEADATEQLRKKGVHVYKFADLAQIRKQTQPIVDQWAAKDKSIASLVSVARNLEGN